MISRISIVFLLVCMFATSAARQLRLLQDAMPVQAMHNGVDHSQPGVDHTHAAGTNAEMKKPESEVANQEPAHAGHSGEDHTHAGHSGDDHTHAGHSSDDHAHADSTNAHTMGHGVVFQQSVSESVLFKFWKTSNIGEYIGSCLFIIALGVLVEFLSKYQKSMTSHGMKTLMYSICAIFSYALMLIVMTFNTGFFFSAVLGLTIGFFAFGKEPVKA